MKKLALTMNYIANSTGITICVVFKVYGIQDLKWFKNLS